jgi:GMP synthase (glutamine-hydrolysing)
MRRVLILQAGSTDEVMRARFGDYPSWFARLLASRVELTVAPADDARLPPLARFDGVLMTGSPRSVLDGDPWMDAAAAYLIEAGRTRPVLGVCFGHQLLARALGGRVDRNPLGREAGTREVRLTEAGTRDPLFRGVPRTLTVQQTHEDHVPKLPPGATLLAENDFSPVQAFAVGDALRCVQFHPEMDAERSLLLAELRRERLDRQAPGGARAVLASIRPSPDAERVLLNWVEQFVGAPAAGGAP